MTFELPERELPAVVKWGRWLLGTSFGLLILGGAIVNVSFPELKGRGLDALALSILVPIWAIGIAGLLLLLVGWIRYPALETGLDLDLLHLSPRADGQTFGGLTKSLALVTAVLLWLGSLAFLLGEDDPNPLWTKGLTFYGITCYCGLIVYLVVYYAKDCHHATTTYLNLFTPLFAFLLVPLLWPLLIVLNGVVFQRERDAVERDEY